MVRARKVRQPTQQNGLNGIISTAASSLTGTEVHHSSSDSPKRKDCKLENVIHKKDIPTSHMVLRRTKSKDQEITKYFTNANPYKLDGSVSEKVIDLTDDRTMDSFNTKDSRREIALSKFRSQFLSNQFSLTDDCDMNKQNIFLQEPVLSLNIDQTAIQPSFVINKILTIRPEENNKNTFTSFLSNSNKNDVQNIHNKNSALDLSQPTQVTDIDSTTNTDSNSCDSGVVADKITELSPSRKKPNTPHRIVCHSPIKAQLTVDAASMTVNNNFDKNKKILPKTRRRILNHSENVTDKTPPQTLPPQQQQQQQQHQQLKCVPKLKPVLNSHINPTAEENTTNNLQSSSNNTNNSSNDNCSKTKLTDFFPVRRSVRKTKKTVQEEILRNIRNAIAAGREDGLEIKYFGEKGRGVVAKRSFLKAEFVVEYIGELISMNEANKREQLYAEDDNTGCYMYYFKHNDQQYCIDATEETGKIGRLVNHSRNGNLLTKTITVNDKPHLVLIAKDNIAIGEELTYDYGDRSKESLQNHPWLAL